MQEKTFRNIATSLVAGALLSTASVSVLASGHDDRTYHLMDSTGKPVISKYDGCVDTPKTPNDPRQVFEICGDIVDSDGDGVTDDKDDCPHNTKEEISKGVDENGCPKDSDNDGVADYRDDCPNNTPLEISKGVDSNGCPKDSDQDGVADYRDLCPGTPYGVKVDADGCGIVQREHKEILGSDVTFGFNKFNLTSQGRATLESIATGILKDDAYVKEVVVTGYTDSIGTDSYNQRLSEKRAASVADYLMKLGVSTAKVIQRGEGERNPIASNKTKAGRAQNRRVEINIRMLK